MKPSVDDFSYDFVVSPDSLADALFNAVEAVAVCSVLERVVSRDVSRDVSGMGDAVTATVYNATGDAVREATRGALEPEVIEDTDP